MSRTCQCSEAVAGSSSGGSEDPWSIPSRFLKCSATPTTERENNSLHLESVPVSRQHCSLLQSFLQGLQFHCSLSNALVPQILFRFIK